MGEHVWGTVVFVAVWLGYALRWRAISSGGGRRETQTPSLVLRTISTAATAVAWTMLLRKSTPTAVHAKYVGCPSILR